MGAANCTAKMANTIEQWRVARRELNFAPFRASSSGAQMYRTESLTCFLFAKPADRGGQTLARRPQVLAAAAAANRRDAAAAAADMIMRISTTLVVRTEFGASGRVPLVAAAAAESRAPSEF